MLDDPDRLALGAAMDARRVPGDPSCLGRKERFGLRVIGSVETAPAALWHEHEQDDGEGCGHAAPEEIPARAARR